MQMPWTRGSQSESSECVLLGRVDCFISRLKHNKELDGNPGVADKSLGCTMQAAGMGRAHQANRPSPLSRAPPGGSQHALTVWSAWRCLRYAAAAAGSPQQLLSGVDTSRFAGQLHLPCSSPPGKFPLEST